MAPRGAVRDQSDRSRSQPAQTPTSTHARVTNRSDRTGDHRGARLHAEPPPRTLRTRHRHTVAERVAAAFAELSMAIWPGTRLWSKRPSIPQRNSAFKAACGKLGVLQSMGRVGSALDNAARKRSTQSLKLNTFTGITSVLAPRHDSRSRPGSWTSTTLDVVTTPVRHGTHRLRTVHGRGQEASRRVTESSTLSAIDSRRIG